MATSKLQRLFGNMLDQRLPEYRIRENYRPDWLISSDLTRLELDFYIEELNIAFEVQGDQHFNFVPFFHKSEDDFKKRRRHDTEKRTLCYGRRIKLVEIMTQQDAEIAVKNIEEKIRRDQPKYFYQDENMAKEYVKKERAKKYEQPPTPGSKKQLKKTEDGRRTERLERCKNNLLRHEKGEINAKNGDVKMWKRIIENNGNI